MQPRRPELLPRLIIRWPTVMISLFLGTLPDDCFAQSATFAGNAQHTALYNVQAQPLNAVHWKTSVDLHYTGFGHYGEPLITPSNTVIASVKITNGFELKAFDGSTGRLKYTLATDFIQPPVATNGWLPVYQPALASPPSGLRLYYPGAGGTVYYIENPDSDTPATRVQQCFYTDIASYRTNTNAFNATIFIDTPITANTNGVIFFGFRVQNTAPAPLNTTNSGFARIDPAGTARYVLAGAAAADPVIYRDSHNSAPALSNDGDTLYVPVKGATAGYAYLLGLDTATLATKYRAPLLDPRNGFRGSVLDDGTASPLVGPDGDVFFGILGATNDGSRGFMLHFSADLQTQKPPGAFGWDNTAALVPTNMVPGYTGPSSYLLFTKYNNYAEIDDGDGINRLAVLDPGATQIDPHPIANGLVEMREVLTVAGPTPDGGYLGSLYPYAVREWCINTAAVNPATRSVFCPSEDGHLYRWDLVANCLTEAIALDPGVDEPYVPTAIGPDGTVYTINGETLFALGSQTNLAFTVSSSTPDLRIVVAGQPLTFAATVTNLDGPSPLPTGTVRFEDMTYQGLNPVTNVLAAAAPLTNGVATVATSSLSAGSNALGNHFITATYSGDGTFPPARAVLVQKVHAYATVMSLASASGISNRGVIFSATVSSAPAGGVPTGMVFFQDGSKFLGQLALKTNGIASLTRTNLSGVTHSINASYASDTTCAASCSILVGTAPYLNGISMLSNGAFQFSFTNTIAASFSVLCSTDLSLPFSNWPVLGPADEILPGQFQFTDPQAADSTFKLYRVRSP